MQSHPHRQSRKWRRFVRTNQPLVFAFFFLMLILIVVVAFFWMMGSMRFAVPR